MTLRDDAMMLGALTAFIDAAKVEQNRLKQVVQEQIESVGADGAPIRLPNGDKVGKASITFKGSESLASVAAEGTFAAWVAHNYPTEVESVPTVFGAFRSLLLNRMVDDGNGGALDPDTGEVVPGVVWSTKQATSFVTTRFDPAKRATKAAPEQPGGKERMLRAILARDVEIVTATSPLAIEDGWT